VERYSKGEMVLETILAMTLEEMGKDAEGNMAKLGFVRS
jgi:hypothetical protein